MIPLSLSLALSLSLSLLHTYTHTVNKIYHAVVLLPLGSPSLTSTNKRVSACHVGATHVVTRATQRVNVFVTHSLTHLFD